MNRNLDFTKLDYDAIGFPTSGFDQWKAKAEKISGKTLDQMVSATMENIDVNPLYTKEDIAGFPHLGHVAGIPPLLPGPLPLYVRHQALDRAPVRRILHCRREQRLLSAQPRGGADGP
uniref:Methylmalonyl-CoA mutase n=1 Tax=Candidatus Kentrum sp. DK TaxID=2126562 RepID=A0A450T6B6_9GAMM|nr:MAG: hypothetical protein BECKDK2373C_GA0170839_10932 [Candidatus Kentron sp. DK]